MSGQHFALLVQNGGIFLSDLNSTNGTFLNGNSLLPHKPEKIREGDKITLANIEFIVE